MKRQRAVSITAGFLLALCAGLIVGCSPQHPSSEQAGAPKVAAAGGTPTKKPQVALVMKSLANSFFQTMQQGAEADQKQHASEYDLISNGIENEQDVTKQVELVEQMIARKVDVIVIAPADSKALVPVCKKAQDAGIVVVNIDNKLDPAALQDQHSVIPFVGPDNRRGSRMVGAYLAKQLKPGDQVAIIDGLPGADNGVQRHLGFQDAMTDAKATVVTSQAADWDTGKANSVVGAILPQYPQLKAILCANDSMALGAVAALNGAGKTKQVLVVGFDNIPAMQQLIKSGQAVCTADQHADLIAVYGIDYGLDILQKKAIPQDKETPVDLITAQTLARQTAP